MLCPFCNEEVIDGADTCDSCGQAIDFLSTPDPVSDVERRLLRDQVSVLNPRAPIVVPPTETVGDVLNLLVNLSIGCVLVVDQGQLVGIFSERDALVRLSENPQAARERPIREFMTPSPESIVVDAEIAYALHKMDIGGYRHLPVMQDQQVIGVISIRDILRYITDKLAARV